MGEQPCGMHCTQVQLACRCAHPAKLHMAAGAATRGCLLALQKRPSAGASAVGVLCNCWR